MWCMYSQWVQYIIKTDVEFQLKAVYVACVFAVCLINYACFVSELGIGLVGFGVMFFCLGILLLFDKALMAIGNVSLLSMNIPAL